MKFLCKTVLWLLILIWIGDESFGLPAQRQVKNGKFMAFTAHDMFSDYLDDVQDPWTQASTVNEKENRLNGTITTTTMRPKKINDTKVTKSSIKAEEKIPLHNQNPGKFKIITTPSRYYSFPLQPVTENGIYYYEGQHYQYHQPVKHSQEGNRTEEIKIFWSAVGDAVENSPYFPIQINVPDMITAMTNFLVNYIPFINRLINPNHPRLPYRVPIKNKTLQMTDYYDNYDIYQPNENILTRREFKNAEKQEEKSNQKRKNRRKSNKKKSQKSTPKGIFQRPSFRKTTIPPMDDLKLWHQFGSDQKETLRLKNMPITRKRVRIADREIFNFKNSDISNSPIMILNVPQRPITHYKISHQEYKEKDVKPEPSQQQYQLPNSQSQPQPQPQLSKRLSKVNKSRKKTKEQEKAKRSSKRSGRSQGEVEEETTSRSTPVGPLYDV